MRCAFCKALRSQFSHSQPRRWCRQAKNMMQVLFRFASRARVKVSQRKAQLLGWALLCELFWTYTVVASLMHLCLYICIMNLFSSLKSSERRAKMYVSHRARIFLCTVSTPMRSSFNSLTETHINTRTHIQRTHSEWVRCLLFLVAHFLSLQFPDERTERRTEKIYTTKLNVHRNVPKTEPNQNRKVRLVNRYTHIYI